MNKIIVIEGPDGAGKSTLAAALSEYFKWPIIHDGGPLTSRQDFLNRIKAKGWDNPEPKICDRICYISELIYAPLHCHEPFVSSLELNNWIDRMKPVIVYCTLDSSKEMVERILMIPKAYKTPEFTAQVVKEHPEITRRYNLVMKELQHTKFNWKKDDLRNLCRHITEQVT